MNEAPICPIHQIPAVWKTGISSKTGRAYAFWSCAGKMPDGGWCTHKFPQTKPSPSVRFDTELHNTGKAIDDKARGDAMGRNNIAHAMIRAGRKPDMDALQEAEAWFRWSRGEMTFVAPKAPQNAPQSVPEGEVSLEDIPF